MESGTGYRAVPLLEAEIIRERGVAAKGRAMLRCQMPRGPLEKGYLFVLT
jgi:hypothetical protein